MVRFSLVIIFLSPTENIVFNEKTDRMSFKISHCECNSFLYHFYEPTTSVELWGLFVYEPTTSLGLGFVKLSKCKETTGNFH